MNARELEKYSSAFTLSDMEVYIFPELMYSLVLANLMSPRLWRWREDPWFADSAGKTFNYRIQRLKQYIMDRYNFNLDLETWGLTTKTREKARFKDILAPDFLARSNALFGYEGDKYYFDLDIRRHFGLDRYDGDVIPYWKTETVEAMDAFRRRPGHRVGAGECVSLAGLYAAALHIVLGVPLEDIFLMATPLHSQNFVLADDGYLTNNRRVVTKKMWFNGTELSQKARRALENERVTIISHISGHAHIDYDEATLDPARLSRFRGALEQFLSTPVTFEIFASFLRVNSHYRAYFQFEYQADGRTLYLPAEKLYRYEHSCRYRLGEAPTAKVLKEIEMEEFSLAPFPGRNTINLLEKKLNERRMRCCDEAGYAELKQLLVAVPDIEEMCRKVKAFACTRPRLPSENKTFVRSPAPDLPVGLSREEIIARLRAAREQNPTADLAFYAGRWLDERGWEPFLKACLERNPVSVLFFRDRSPDEIYRALTGEEFSADSIYDGPTRLATPDEVVNFRAGDGLEKALALANVLLSRSEPGASCQLDCQTPGKVLLRAQEGDFSFDSAKAPPVSSAGLSARTRI